MQTHPLYASISPRALTILAVLGLHLSLIQLLNDNDSWRDAGQPSARASLALLTAPAVAPVQPPQMPRTRRAPTVSRAAAAASLTPATSENHSAPPANATHATAEPREEQVGAAGLAAALDEAKPAHISTTLKLDLKDSVGMIDQAERRRRAQPPLEQWGKFEKATDFARAAECGKDTFKHDPPPTIAGFQLGGLLLLPFAAKTILTGKCKF